MKTAIVYYSKHHGNTKKLLDAIAAENEVTLIDVTEQPSADLSGYDRIGFASGIYYNSFAKQLLTYAQDCLPAKKDVFYLFTHGAPKGVFLTAIRKIAEQKQCREIDPITAWDLTPSVRSSWLAGSQKVTRRKKRSTRQSPFIRSYEDYGQRLPSGRKLQV